MNINTLDLNDSGIGLYRDKQLLINSPGFAVCDGDQLFMGIDAQQRARILPRHMNHRFWSQLSLDNMAQPFGRLHRHADIAYAHLQAICTQANHPEELFLAVPSSYQSEQLALLLGISEQCNFKCAALIDSALAACVLTEFSTKTLLHVDLQLHQAVVTEFEVFYNELRRGEVLILPNSGLQSLLDKWARYCASQCIYQTRFDPMYSAQSEQDLYNQLPQWLISLQTDTEITVQLDGHSFRLNQQQLLDSSDGLYNNLLTHLVKPNATIALSHRIAALPHFTSRITDAIVLSETALVDGIAYCEQWIRSDQAQQAFITSLVLPKVRPPVFSSNTPLEKRPTHILWQHQAYPLNFFPVVNGGEGYESFYVGTSIPPNKKGLTIESKNQAQFGCEIFRSNDQMWLHIDHDSENVIALHQHIEQKNLPWSLKFGDKIHFASHDDEAMLIHVLVSGEKHAH